MIAEWLMERYGWRDVWYLGSNTFPRYRRWWKFLTAKSAYIGVWTGPQHDLICVKECTTNEEAERYLSPEGWTILDAAIRSWWKLLNLDGAVRKSASCNGRQRTESHSSTQCRGGCDSDG